jgi:hypothetical protein
MALWKVPVGFDLKSRIGVGRAVEFSWSQWLALGIRRMA